MRSLMDWETIHASKDSAVRILFHLVWSRFIPSYQFQLFGAKQLCGSHYPPWWNARRLIFKQLVKGGGCSKCFSWSSAWDVGVKFCSNYQNCPHVQLCSVTLQAQHTKMEIIIWAEFNVRAALLLNLCSARGERVSCKLMFKPKHTSFYKKTCRKMWSLRHGM